MGPVFRPVLLGTGILVSYEPLESTWPTTVKPCVRRFSRARWGGEVGEEVGGDKGDEYSKNTTLRGKYRKKSGQC